MNKLTRKIQREITPLSNGDCLLVFDRIKTKFDFPVHFHPEFELNFILHANGAERIVGDHRSLIGNNELVLVGPNLYHGWSNGQCQSEQIHEITVQFQRNLMDESLLSRKIMKSIREMLENSSRGILFSEIVTKQITQRLIGLSQKNGTDAFTELILILDFLAVSKNQMLLCTASNNLLDYPKNDELCKICAFIERNYQEKIKIGELAAQLNITETTLSRLVKKRTGKTFVEFVNDYRIGFASRLLTETNQTIAEIAFKCGFFNISNFNRIFRKNKGCRPGQYRENFSGIKKVN